ncbi:penicillin-binding protein 2, partial [candidate division WOR-3 bacterium]|nr:penicillin-binding protein 2 [candidate division WOR-3 bacterium]
MAALPLAAVRLRRVTALVLVLFGVLVLRLAQLQLAAGRRYARLSDRNRVRRIDLPAPRGRIFDRRGALIADSRPSFAVAAIPTELPDSCLPLLAGLLSTSTADLRRLIAPVARVPALVNIRRNVGLETAARVEENRFRLPGVLVRVEPVRDYPEGERYCHAVGHLGEVSDEELAADTSYRRLDFVGRAGIEARYERWLRGRDGLEYAEVDASGREIGPLREKRPEHAVPGMDLHLTLDARLQALACTLVSGYERAAVVGLDIHTGAVLCLVSRPGYDPNVFTAPISAAAWDALAGSPARPFFNRVTAAGYPPGSTLKPLVALAALDCGVLAPGTVLDPCTGSLRYGNRTFRCWSVHGRLNLLDAIAQSCNCYFYQTGLRLGLDSLAAHCRRYGLGTRTGIDLPGEKAGNVPSRDWLDSRYGPRRWTSGVVLNFAIGQGEVLATPLQMAMVYAAIAGNGTCARPYMVQRIDSAGRAVYAHVPEPLV